MSIIAIADKVYKIYKITKRFTKRNLVDPPGYRRIVEQFPPGYRPYVKDVLRGSDIAFSGGLISQVLQQINDGISPEITSTNNNEQARNNLDKSQFKSKYNSYSRSRKRQKACRCKRFYRSSPR